MEYPLVLVLLSVRLSSPTLQTVQPISPGPICDGSKLYPDRSSCRNYYRCVSGNLVWETCPALSEFSAVYRWCLPPMLAECSLKKVAIAPQECLELLNVTPGHTTPATTLTETPTASVINTDFTQCDTSKDPWCNSSTPKVANEPTSQKLTPVSIVVTHSSIESSSESTTSNTTFKTPCNLSNDPTCETRTHHNTDADRKLPKITIDEATTTEVAAAIKTNSEFLSTAASTCDSSADTSCLSTHTIPTETSFVPATFPCDTSKGNCEVTTPKQFLNHLPLSNTRGSELRSIYPLEHCSKYGLSHDPLDCHSYYLCMKGTWSHKKCPESMNFSASHAECLPATSVDCAVTTLKTLKNSASEAFPEITSKPLSGFSIITKATVVHPSGPPTSEVSNMEEIPCDSTTESICAESLNLSPITDTTNTIYFLPSVTPCAVPTDPLCEAIATVPSSENNSLNTETNDPFSPEPTAVPLLPSNTGSTGQPSSAWDTSSVLSFSRKISVPKSRKKGMTTGPMSVSSQEPSKQPFIEPYIGKDCLGIEIQPDVTDCKKFYSCVDGIWQHKMCALHMEFSTRFMRCLPWFLAHCSVATTPSSTEKSSSVTFTDTSMEASAYPVSTTTPLSEEPIYMTEALNPNHDSISSDSLVTYTASTTPPYCTENMLYPNPASCHEYYLCENGNLTTKTCPGAQQFSFIYHACLPPLVAGCVEHKSKVPDSLKKTMCIEIPDYITDRQTKNNLLTSLTTSEPTVNMETTTIWNPSDSSSAKSIESLEEYSEKFRATDELKHSSKDQSGETEVVEEVQQTFHDSNKNNTEFSNEQPTNNQPTNNDQENVAIAVLPGLEAETNNSLVHLLPSIKLTANEESIESNGEHNPSKSSNTFKPSDVQKRGPLLHTHFCHDWVLYPNPRDCTKYYTCVHGTLVEAFCPESHEFDEDLQKCLPPGPVPCQSNTIYRIATVKCPQERNKLTRYMDPLNCEYYFTCYNGRSSHERCDDGDEFSPSKLTCMPAAEAMCRHYAEKKPVYLSGILKDSVNIEYKQADTLAESEIDFEKRAYDNGAKTADDKTEAIRDKRTIQQSEEELKSRSTENTRKEDNAGISSNYADDYNDSIYDAEDKLRDFFLETINNIVPPSEQRNNGVIESKAK